MRMFSKIKMALAIGLCLAGATASAQVRGVTDKEITLGLVTDLSGPIVNYGKESRNGMTLGLEEINAAGGIAGRKIRLVVEDHGYDPRKSILATTKLVQQDQIFASLGLLGTATNMAALPFMLENKVFNFMPQGGSAALYEPPSPYKVALAPSYVTMTAAAVDFLLKKHPYKRVGALYQDDDFGREAMEGLEKLLAERKMPICEKTSYKRGATDFSSQIAKLKAANCDLVFSATTLREYIGSMSEARKTGFMADFIGTAASYSPQIPTLGGKAVEGGYAYTFITLPTASDPNAAVRDWVGRYKARFGDEPGLYSMYSYYAITAFAKFAEKAGRNLTPESFNAAMESTKLPMDALGNPAIAITATNRLSNDRVRVTQIVDGKWVAVSEYVGSPFKH